MITALFVVRSISPNFAKLFKKRSALSEVFRQAVARVVVHSESIAALNGDDREHYLVTDSFRNLQKHVRRMTGTQWWFGMIEDFVTKYAASTMAMIVILGPFFGGNLRTDYTPEGNATTLATMRYVTSVIINQLTAIGGLARCVRKVISLHGHVQRVGSMRDALLDIREHTDEEMQFLDGNAIAFDGVEVVTPNGHSLVSDLSFLVKPGQNLLITGPNGAGKSSIFRCLGALWSVKKGSITRPGGSGQGLHDKVFYLPQKPYNVVGDLRDQIMYPVTSELVKEQLTDSSLRNLLTLVELDYLFDQNQDSNVNWEDKLSLGETQRLAMARLLYHRPVFAILDECTSAVSHAMERRLYRLCEEHKITCITISHRPALIALHDMRLELCGNGRYNFELLHRHKETDALSDAQINDMDQSALESISSSSSSLSITDEATVEELDPSQHSWLSNSDESDHVGHNPLNSPLSLVKRSKKSNRFARLMRLFRFLIPKLTGTAGKMLSGLGIVVILRVFLTDRIARLNGETVRLLLLDDLPAFKRLVGVSLVQCMASAILAPTLVFLTRSLSMHWQEKLQTHLSMRG